jgi:hypothetical protein
MIVQLTGLVLPMCNASMHNRHTGRLASLPDAPPHAITVLDQGHLGNTRSGEIERGDLHQIFRLALWSAPRHQPSDTHASC